MKHKFSRVVCAVAVAGALLFCGGCPNKGGGADGGTGDGPKAKEMLGQPGPSEGAGKAGKGAQEGQEETKQQPSDQ